MIQDLIEASNVVTNGLVRNANHKAFKQPLLEYKKGETSKATKKNHDAKISYAYASAEKFIGMLEPIEYLCMISPNDNQLNSDVEPNSNVEDEQSKVVLKM